MTFNDNNVILDDGRTVVLNGNTLKAMGMPQENLGPLAKAVGQKQMTWGNGTQAFIATGGVLDYSKVQAKPPVAQSIPQLGSNIPMTLDEMKVELARLQAENSQLKSTPLIGQVMVITHPLGGFNKDGVAYKGNIGVLGINQRGIWLYKNQVRKMVAAKVWEQIVAACDADDKLPLGQRKLSEGPAKGQE